MPNIPQYTSKANLTETTSIPNATPGKTGEMLQDIGSAVEKTGSVIQQVEEKIRQINNANEESNAAIAKKEWEYKDSETRSKQPDVKHLDSLPEDVRKNTEEIAKTFSDQEFRQKWLNKQKLDDETYIIQQKVNAAKKVVSERKVQTHRDLELEASNYINAQTEEDRSDSVKNMEAIANNPANADIFDAEDRKKLVDDTIKSAEASLKDIESLKQVKAKELREAEKEAANEREKDLLEMKMSGKETREELIKLTKQQMKSELIGAKFANSFINALKSPKAVKAKTIDKDFANVIYEINQGKMKPEAIRNAILDLVSYGNLSEQDFTNATIYLDMITDNNVDDLVTQGRRGSWSAISNWANNNTAKELEAESRARMSRNYISKLQSGIEPSLASIETMREETLFLRPEARNYPEGMNFIDNDGRMKKIMPNGDLLEVETKPKSK